MKRFLFFLVLVLVLAGAGYWAYRNDKLPFSFKQKQEDKLADLTLKVVRRDIDSTLMLAGEVNPEFQVEIKSEVGGKLKQLAVKAGAVVKKGDLLAVIDDTVILTDKAAAEKEIAGAQIAVNRTKGNYTRAGALYKEKLISKEIYDNLRADYELAENTLDKSRTQMQTVIDQLDKTRILAPTAGTVLDTLVGEGQVVVAAASINSGTTIMNFADVGQLVIKSHVNQVDAPKLKLGQEAQVSISGHSTESIPAVIAFIAPLASIRNNIKGFPVDAVITDNKDDFLKPGMSVSLTVPIAKAMDVLAIPVNAIFRNGKIPMVYVRPDPKMAPEKRVVEVGATDNNFVEIRSGLKEGDEILLMEPNQ